MKVLKVMDTVVSEKERIEMCDEDLELDWLCLGLKLCLVVAFSVLVGVILLVSASVFYSRPRGLSRPSSPHDIAVRAEHMEEGVVTVLWEASECGTAVGYVVERWNALLGVWMEVRDSPTMRQGVRDRNLPESAGGETVLEYRISAVGESGGLGGVGETWVRMAEFDSGGKGLVFFSGTSKRAGRKPRDVEVMDMSMREDEKKLLVKWEPGEEKALGYALFVWSFVSRRYEVVEAYEGFRRSSKVPVSSRGPHCFVVKERSWGDVGLSPPSAPSCIYVRHWAYEDIPDCRTWVLDFAFESLAALHWPQASTMAEDRGQTPHYDGREALL